jgi:glucosamine 6-phosphate synthetase-like amidotransferase/phosphosugar isomerase protein
MCGIFGFILKKPISMKKIFGILKKLETSKYLDEMLPLGGYGAGIAVMLPDGDVISEKVGKTSDSPAAQLEEIVENKTIMNAKLSEASVLLGHVRFPSPEHMDTADYKEGAQPYVEHFEPQLTIVSAHNGNVVNYRDLQAKIKTHVFESEKVGLVDSEVIPHYFGELLNETKNTDTAVYELFSAMKGSNVAALLQIDEENAFIHLVYRGKARGLTVWANDKGEVIFCSRSEPVEEELKSLLAIGKFQRKVTIDRKEDAGLKLSFPAILQ